MVFRTSPATDLSSYPPLLPPTSQLRAFPLSFPVLDHIPPDICVTPTLPSRRYINIIQSVTMIILVKKEVSHTITKHFLPFALLSFHWQHLPPDIPYICFFTVSSVRVHKGRDFISSKTYCLKISAVLYEIVLKLPG